jgi:iron complex transport system substrate-binding protein
MKKRYFLLLILLLIPCLTYSAPPERTISLAPSITEILYALGLEDRIVGVTNFCDYPPGAKNKPKVGGMSNPSLEAVVRLKPDIVILTTDGNPKEFEERLRSLDIRTYVFKARRLTELADEIRRMGKSLGVTERAEELAEKIENTIKRYSLMSQQITSAHPPRKKAVFIIWPEPLIVAGPDTAIDDALRLLGWDNIASDAVARYPKYSVEELLYRRPDVILIGKGHINMREISKGLLKRIQMLDAVKQGRVYFVSDALYRLGPRVIDGIEELDRILNQDRR